jgi:hypothetical protein
MAGSPARACLNVSWNQRSTQSLTTCDSGFRSLCDTLPLGSSMRHHLLVGGGGEGLLRVCSGEGAAAARRLGGRKGKRDEARGEKKNTNTRHARGVCVNWRGLWVLHFSASWMVWWQRARGFVKATPDRD